MRRIGLTVLCVLGLAMAAACNAPRGAALRSEVLKEADADTPTFAVVPVTRATVPGISRWPATGWSGGYSWPEGTGGPGSSIIRPGDSIDLIIWENQENSLLAAAGAKTAELRGIVVSPTGTVFVPYLDEVVVNGMTPPEARRMIETQLLPIVPSAQVQLMHAAGRGNTVDLVSGVAQPGSFPLPDRNFTILSLIAQGGGISPGLRNPLVRLIRDGRTWEIRAERLFSEASRNVVLRGGDKVLVAEDERAFTALGATGTEELVYFSKDDITALEALSMIGGLADARANPKGVLVLREYPARAVRRDGSGPAMQQVVFTIDLTSADGLFAARNFRIQPRDTVLATESPVSAVRSIVSLFQGFFSVGNAAGL